MTEALPVLHYPRTKFYKSMRARVRALSLFCLMLRRGTWVRTLLLAL